MEQLLSGEVAHQEQAEALAEVQAGLAALPDPPKGVHVVGSQEYVVCTEGQNNWKVKDGYQFRCGAGGMRYLGWDGDLHEGAVTIVKTYEKWCDAGGHVGPAPRSLPAPGRSCGRGDQSVGVQWVERDEVLADIACRSDSVRCMLSDTEAEIQSRISKHEWFATEIIPLRDYYVQ